MNKQQLEILLQALRAVQVSPADTRKGICGNVEAILYLAGAGFPRHGFYDFREQAHPSWPEWSGCTMYPVPGPFGVSASDYYWLVSDDYHNGYTDDNLW